MDSQKKLILTILFLVFASLSLNSTAFAEKDDSANNVNVLSEFDPGFEDGFKHWSMDYGSASVSFDTETKRSGKQSLRIITGSRLRSEKLIKVEPGYKYYMSVWGKIKKFKFIGSKYGCGFGLHEIREDGKSINGDWYDMQAYVLYAEGDSEWAYAKRECMPKATTVYLQPVIHVDALPDSIAWYDDIYVWKEKVVAVDVNQTLNIIENGSFEIRYRNNDVGFGFDVVVPDDFKGNFWERAMTVEGVATERVGSMKVIGPVDVYSSPGSIIGDKLNVELSVKSEDVKGEGVYVDLRLLNSKRQEVARKSVVLLKGTKDWQSYKLAVDKLTSDTVYAQLVFGMKKGTTGIAYFDDLKVLVNARYAYMPDRGKNIEKVNVTVDCSKRKGVFESPLDAYDSHCANRIHSWSIGTAGEHLEGPDRWHGMRKKLGINYVRVHEGFEANSLCEHLVDDGTRSFAWTDGERGVSFSYPRTRYPDSNDLLPPVCSIDANGTMITDFTAIKHYLDHSVLKGGTKPIFGLEPVPSALALNNNTHYMPRDLKLWEEFNYRFIKFLIDSYGEDEVRTWIFETSNEPSTEPTFHGRPNRTAESVLKDFLVMQDYTIAGARRALPDIFIAGPSGPPEYFVEPMLEHCAEGINHATGQKGTQLDAISYHGYLGGNENDMSWRPSEQFIARFVGYIDKYYKKTGKRLELYNTEGAPFYIPSVSPTEQIFSPADNHISAVASIHIGNFSHNLGVKRWAYFYEHPMYMAPVRNAPNLKYNQNIVPEFLGLDTMISFHGIFNPVCRAFEMMSWLNGCVEIVSEADKEPIFTIATVEKDRIKVLCYSYDVDPKVEYVTKVNMEINSGDIGKKFKVTRFELSKTKANSAYLAYQEKLTQADCEKDFSVVDRINKASELKPEAFGEFEAKDGKVKVSFDMPAYSASLFVFEKVE